MTIGDQFLPMFHYDVTHRIHPAWATRAVLFKVPRLSVFDDCSSAEGGICL